MVKDYYTVQELVEYLDIDTISAEELLDGIIDFELDELYALALYKGISIEKLIICKV